MNKLFPHPPYAEEQPHAHSILTIHVLRAGLATGSILSVLTATITTIYKRQPPSQYARRLVLHASRGSVAGVLVSGVMLTGKMWGKEDIEWKDRAWQLLGNKSQCQADTWVAAGSVIGGMGVMALALRRGGASVAGAASAEGVLHRVAGAPTPSSIGIPLNPGMALAGGVGLGSAAGMVGSVLWSKRSQPPKDNIQK
ncbi:hypothetical protein FQN57_006380 [Myotisia sp. PD_48]|nr:hypothetical protein FQN57_006380 [Myotisia sp. PD_48]